MQSRRAEALITTEDLAELLGQPHIKVVDASWYLPAEKRDPHREFAQGHIPGAVYFDIDKIADTSSPLPHTFPTAEFFSRAVGALGISTADRVICYDGGKMAAAARAWWMFRAFGHTRVQVLDGGLGKWRVENRPLEAGPPAPIPARYEARFNPALVRGFDEMLAIVRGGGEQILDARSAGRFNGTEPEPRAGLRSGHMPGARNLPFFELLAPNGTLKPEAELKEILRRLGVDPTQPVVTSCGSGVSATVPLLALYILGADRISLYDGSWSEWGGRPEAPVVTSQP